MTRKQKKQLEIRYTVHRCQGCKRELKAKDSIARGRGPKCFNQHQRHLRNLRTLAYYENG